MDRCRSEKEMSSGRPREERWKHEELVHTLPSHHPCLAAINWYSSTSYLTFSALHEPFGLMAASSRPRYEKLPMMKGETLCWGSMKLYLQFLGFNLQYKEIIVVHEESKS